MAGVVAAVLLLGIFCSSYIVVCFVALIAAIATFELIYNIAGIRNKLAILGSVIYTAISTAVIAINGAYSDVGITEPSNIAGIYFLFAAIIMIFYHSEFSLEKILIFALAPIAVSFGFARICGVTLLDGGIYYLLLMLNFSSVCDMGAYFVGSMYGRRKLCPEISPKKTVEGALGGMAASVIFSLILALCFGSTSTLLMTLVLTVPFCMIGIIGDLFFSLIKRAVGIKDYGNLIPGHGGILDRFDSMLFIAPFLYMYATVGVL